MMNAAPTSEAVLDRSKAPVAKPMPATPFPSHATHTLANGLHILLVPNRTQPLVTASLYVRGGASLDRVGEDGAAAMMADLITKGTTTRSAMQLADEIDFLGASLSASAGWDNFAIGCSTLSRFADQAFGLLADVIVHPTFPAEELERIRLQRLASLRQAKAEAGFLADSLFAKLVFGGHTYGHLASGTEQTVAAISREEIARLYAQNVSPANSFLVVAGDMDEAEMVQRFEHLFADWKRTDVGRLELPTPVATTGRRVGLVTRESAVQSAIRVGHVGVARKNNDDAAVAALNMALGGYFGSRINLNLREKNGYTYGARCAFDMRNVAGSFFASTEVRTEVTAAAVKEIIYEIEQMVAKPLEPKELKMVKDYMIGSFPLQMETPHQVAGKVATIELYGLAQNYYDSYREAVAKLTADDIHAAANTYLHPDNLIIVASCDVNAIRESMEAFGPLTAYDSDLNPA